MRNYMRTGMQGSMDCGCMPEEASYINDDFVVAMAYVPWQYFTTVYEPDKALQVGTIFPELDKPFLAGGRCCGR